MALPDSAKVAQQFLRKNGVFQTPSVDMDFYARARILEGAGDLPKWSLSRNPRIFFTEGPPQFPDVDPEWFNRRDTGLVKSVLQGAWSVLKSETGEATAEEIMQNMTSGLSVSGATKQDVFGYVGKNHSQAIISGKKEPKDFKGILYGYGKQKAIDVWRKMVRQVKELEKEDPVVRSSATGMALDRSPLDVILSLLSSSKGRDFKNWIYQTIQRKGSEVQKYIMEATFEYMAIHQKWPPAAAITDQVAELKGSSISISKINRHRKAVTQMLQQEMAKNPTILDWMDRYLDLTQMGYGGELRLAKKATLKTLIQRVADRFLSGSVDGSR